MTPYASLAAVREALPAYARDTVRNLDVVVAHVGPHLSEQQHWGAVLAAAAANRSQLVTPALAAEARAHLTDEAYDAARGAASLMATTSVYYRARRTVDGADDADVPPRAGLRLGLELAPGAPRADFELWCVAGSAVAGCVTCVRAHTARARAHNATTEAVDDVVRIAAVVTGVVATLEAAAVT